MLAAFSDRQLLQEGKAEFGKFKKGLEYREDRVEGGQGCYTILK